MTADMGDMRLLGYVPPRQSLKPGELLDIGLYWRALKQPSNDYFVTIQLRDATGRVAFEQFSRPAHDTYPTTRWDEGEVLLDWHEVEIPGEIMPSMYQVWVLLRDAQTNQSIGAASLVEIGIMP